MRVRIANPFRHAAMLGAAALLTACASGGGQRAEVEIRGTDPANAPRNVPAGDPIATPGDDRKMVTVGPGVTLASVAAENGLSVSQLAAYNGVTPDHDFRPGDVIVLPPVPETGDVRVAAAAEDTPEVLPPREPTLDAQPIGSPEIAAGEPADAGADAARGDGPIPLGEGVPGADGPLADDVGPSDPDWSPDRIEAALDRSLGKPPSADDPIPPEPSPRRELDSPQLGQYQTERSLDPDADANAPAANGAPETADRVAAADPAPEADPAAASPPARSVRLAKPVVADARVAIAFNKSAEGVRNDGVDFAAPAGSPVFAADDGEVALVSQSLGGLGTIVLVRHKDELLTVYGRIDDVSIAKGDIVRRGQQIGVVSNATAPAEPRMHFEVRRGAESLNPMDFL